MTLLQVWGALILFIVCPLLGGIQLKAGLQGWLGSRPEAQAADSRGARLGNRMRFLDALDGITGIIAVLLARYFFPNDPVWEVVALIALVIGQYWITRTTNLVPVMAGFILHDWITAGFVLLLSLISFTIFRQRRNGLPIVLVLAPVITALRHGDGTRMLAMAMLCGLIIWVAQKEKTGTEAAATGDSSGASGRGKDGQKTSNLSQGTFQFFRSDRALLHLDLNLDARQVGPKAAALSQLKQWGYPVPIGWIFLPGDDIEAMVEGLRPSERSPLMLRSAALEPPASTRDSSADKTGITRPRYQPVLNITNKSDLAEAITLCLISYNRSPSQAGPIAVFVQRQIQGVFSGVARSQDLIQTASEETGSETEDGTPVTVTAVPGDAVQLFRPSLQPERYRVWVKDSPLDTSYLTSDTASWVLPVWAIAQTETESLTQTGLAIRGAGRVAIEIIQQVDFLVRHIEARYQGVPQEIEWSYDGQQLWILRVRSLRT